MGGQPPPSPPPPHVTRSSALVEKGTPETWRIGGMGRKKNRLSLPRSLFAYTLSFTFIGGRGSVVCLRRGIGRGGGTSFGRTFESLGTDQVISSLFSQQSVLVHTLGDIFLCTFGDGVGFIKRFESVGCTGGRRSSSRSAGSGRRTSCIVVGVLVGGGSTG